MPDGPTARWLDGPAACPTDCPETPDCPKIGLFLCYKLSRQTRDRETFFIAHSLHGHWRALHTALPAAAALCLTIGGGVSAAQPTTEPSRPAALVYGGDSGFPPYEYIDVNGNPAGF